MYRCTLPRTTTNTRTSFFTSAELPHREMSLRDATVHDYRQAAKPPIFREEAITPLGRIRLRGKTVKIEGKKHEQKVRSCEKKGSGEEVVVVAWVVR